MGMLRYTFATACLLPLAGLWGGCAFGANSNDDPKDEVVGEAESAFGEAACGTDVSGGAGTYVKDTGIFFGCPAPSSTHTSSSTYGDAACPHAYIVQYSGAVAGGSQVFGTWGGAALPQATCSQAAVQVAVYNSAGTRTALKVTRGVWSAGGGFSLPGCVLSDAVQISGTNSRVVAAAGIAGTCNALGCSFVSFAPVTLTIQAPIC